MNVTPHRTRGLGKPPLRRSFDLVAGDIAGAAGITYVGGLLASTALFSTGADHQRVVSIAWGAVTAFMAGICGVLARQRQDAVPSPWRAVLTCVGLLLGLAALWLALVGPEVGRIGLIVAMSASCLLVSRLASRSETTDG